MVFISPCCEENVCVLFISRDKGFIEYIDKLQSEFLEFTGKEVEIKDNSYYKVLLGDEEEPVNEERVNEETEEEAVKEVPNKVLSDIEKASLRKLIKDVFSISVMSFSI